VTSNAHPTSESAPVDGDDSAVAGGVAARVLVAAATALYRDGVLAALSGEQRFLVVGSAQDAHELVWRVVAERPDVTLLDVELLRAAVDRGLLPSFDEGPRLIVIAVTDCEADITACANAGATDIVRRSADRKELLATVDRALEGRSRFSSLVSTLLAARGPDPTPVSTSLTPRQAEILWLIEAGRTNQAIAQELGCSVSTVKNHVHAILARLGVSRRTEAGRLARDMIDWHDGVTAGNGVGRSTAAEPDPAA
jgi:DNA-binding NarL/FixJ family response regulator